MKINTACFWLPKAGNSPKEYEDAFYPKHGGERNGPVHHFAVADGAGEGLFSGKWAEILVKCCCRGRQLDKNLDSVVQRACSSWKASIGNYLTMRKVRDKPVQWYEEAGLQAGAFSSLLWVTIKGASPAGPGKWEAAALGDTCLFLVRRQKKLAARFPCKNSLEFNNRPLLISSSPAKNGEAADSMKTAQGEWKPGDVFYIMTDAIACWFLRQYEVGRKPWRQLFALSLKDDGGLFRAWIENLRTEKLLRNDDITIIRIECRER